MAEVVDLIPKVSQATKNRQVGNSPGPAEKAKASLRFRFRGELHLRGVGVGAAKRSL